MVKCEQATSTAKWERGADGRGGRDFTPKAATTTEVMVLSQTPVGVGWEGQGGRWSRELVGSGVRRVCGGRQ